MKLRLIDQTSYNMKYSILILFLINNSVKISFTTHSLEYLENYSDEDDSKLNFTQLVDKYGMATEEYDIQTEDGYILKLFRIPGYGKPVLLQHGFMDSADSYILRGRTSLAAILVANGYDVWLGNLRGNKHSRRHKTLNPDTDDKFWDFSIHEYAVYDLAAMINFILFTTKQTNLIYIGHSQGTTIMFILASTRPEYNEKVEVFVALCPVVYLENVSAANSLYIQLGDNINKGLKSLHMEELFGPNSTETQFVRYICASPNSGYFCLDAAVFPSAGFNPSELEKEFIPVFFTHFPSGASRTVLHHFLQIGKSGQFRPYNYGYGNYARYGSAAPKPYDLKKVTMPTILVNSKNDGFSSVTDTNKIKIKLPNVVNHLIVKPPLFNHIDFLVGLNAYKVVYPAILEILKSFTFNL